VAEGVKTTTPVLEMAATKGIELPIAAEVGRVLEGGAPEESVVRLMGRGPKAEGYGLRT
jgi:glycerol-3-phosphate dehydrogenase